MSIAQPQLGDRTGYHTKSNKIVFTYVMYTVRKIEWEKAWERQYLGYWFSVSRKGRTWGGGLLYTPKGEIAWLSLGLALKNPSVGSFLLL